MGINKTGLRKLVKRLEALRDNHKRVTRFNMHYWGSPLPSVSGGKGTKFAVENPPVCNTQACLAGEYVLSAKLARVLVGGGINLFKTTVNKFKLPAYTEGYIPEAAAADLRLDVAQAQRLFYFKTFGYHNGWPEALEAAYHDAETPEARVQVAIDRVKLFIKTNGGE